MRPQALPNTIQMKRKGVKRHLLGLERLALQRITPISIAVLRFLAGSTYFPGHRTRRVVSSSRRQHKGDAVKFPRARVQTPGSHDKKRSLYTMYGGAFSYLSAPNTSPPSMLHFQQAP